MGRVGKQPIELPAGVKANIAAGQVKITGPKGNLELEVPKFLNVKLAGDQILIEPKNSESIFQKSLWGTNQRLIANMVAGVSEGFTKELEVNGVGYKVDLKDKNLSLSVGYSDAKEFKIPEGIEAQVDKNIIKISGIDKQLVGEVAAQIRKIRKPEPYKGKGIKYVDEVVRRKAGKQVKGASE